MLIEAVKEFLSQHRIDPAANRLFLACSGGIDSMVLAHVLLELRVEFELVHCNFRLRGTQSDEDESFCREWAQKNRLKFHCRSFDTSNYTRQKKISTQMAARELRYSFFESLLSEDLQSYMMTAHHLDDSLETMLINLGRGTGLKGLTGIPDIRDQYIRPLSECSEVEIKSYAIENEINWREDSSNQSDAYQRNFLRLKVIPQLKEAFPSFDKSFRQTVQNLRADQHMLESGLLALHKDLVTDTGEEQRLDIKALLEYAGYQSFIHHWLAPYGKFDLQSICESLSKEGNLNFASHSHILLKDRGQLILREISEPPEIEVVIHKEEVRLIEPLDMSMKFVDYDGNIETDKSIAMLDADKLEFPLTLRRWKAGDSFQPLGMKAFKKLSDFLIDNKLTRFEKENTWVLCSGEKVVWVVNHRIDNRFKLSSKTKTIYFVQLLR